MHARGTCRVLSLAALLLVALAACDDSSEGPSSKDMGAGGEGGEGGEGGQGGAGGQGGEGGEGGEGGQGGEPVECDPACDPGQICRDGVCGPCSRDAECPGNEICEGGACIQGCPEAACPGTPGSEQCCDGRCQECCVDSDCPSGTCAGGLCQLAGCDAQSGGTRDCGEGQVCDDGADQCVGDFDCSADGCPGSITCLDNGACRPNFGERCTSHAECALGQVCNSARQRICAPCAVDADCPGAQTCEARTCVEPGACTGDEDCILGRVCNGGLCEAPACDDDAAESNNEMADATRIAGDRLRRGLVSCDPDWFQVVVPADTVVTVEMRQLDFDADLDLVVYGEGGVELDRSETGLPSEGVVVGPFVSERPIYILVTQNRAPWSVGAYDLDVRFVSADVACRDDGFELGAGDDTPSTGRLVRVQGQAGFGGSVEGRICPADTDHICFYIETREEIGIEVEVTAGNPRIVGRVLNRDGMEVQAGRWGRGGAEMPIAPFTAPRGTYCLALTTESEGGRYSVRLTAVSPEVRAACDAAVDATVGRPVSGALGAEDAERSVFEPRCADNAHATGEGIYRIIVDEPALLVARAVGLASGTLGDPVISVRAECRHADTELACSTGRHEADNPLFPMPNPAEVRVPLTGAGDYWVFVDGVGPGQTPNYELQIETRALAAAPRNERCDSAQEIQLANGVAELTANLDRATDDVSGGCLGNGGPDAVWVLNLERPSRVRVQVAGDGFAAGAYLVERCGDSPSACGYGFVREVPAGRWYVVLDGADANSRGRVTAQVVVEPRDAGQPNDTCASAEVLEARGGQLQGNTGPARDDYQLAEPNRCTSYNSVGGDLVYALDLSVNDRVYVQAEPVGGWDLSLYVVTDCGDLAACVDGSDGALTETVVFTAERDQRYHVIVDGTNGERGAFNLRWGPAECENDGACGAGRRCVNFVCAQ